MCETCCLKGYNFIKKIGSGATSEVYLVKCNKSLKSFACKVIKRNSLNDIYALSGLERELRLHKMLNHPNIVKLSDVIYTEEKIFLIMDYCANGDLLQQMHENPFFIQVNILKIIRQLLSALSYIHSKNIAHHDIKPENILFDDQYNAYLSDFGCAADEITDSQYIGGTPEYMAPEIISGSAKDRRKGDIWSLGVIIHEIVFNARPNEKKICSNTFSNDSNVIKGMHLMLIKDEDKRPSAHYLLNVMFKEHPTKIIRTQQVFRKFQTSMKRPKTFSGF